MYAKKTSDANLSQNNLICSQNIPLQGYYEVIYQLETSHLDHLTAP